MARLIDLLTAYERRLESWSRTTKGRSRYVWSAGRFIGWAGGEDVEVRDLDAALLRQYQDESLAGTSPGFINAEISALRCFFDFLRTDAGLVGDPAAGLKAEPKPEPLPKALALTERDAVLAAIAWPDGGLDPATRFRWQRGRLGVLTVWYAGLRLAELAHLRYRAIDLRGETITVYAAAGAKRRRERQLPLHPALRAEYEAIPLERRQGEMHVLQRAEDGQAYGYRNTEHIFDTWLASRAGIHPLGAHRLRHTFATMLMEKDVSLRRIQKYLGHSSLATTARYLGLVDDGDRSAIRRLDG